MCGEKVLWKDESRKEEDVEEVCAKRVWVKSENSVSQILAKMFVFFYPFNFFSFLAYFFCVSLAFLKSYMEKGRIDIEESLYYTTQNQIKF